ncbi:MAG: electron transfer flavoprotein subunit alpha/FixB family protein [Anaerostipes hadrus]
MNLGKKEGIVVVGEIQKREIMPLTLELIGAAGKLSKERDLSLSVILSGCGIKEEAKKLYNYGVDEILCIEDEKLIEGHMQLHHDAVIEVLKGKDPKVILIGGTASGRVLAGKTAYAFDTELVCDASKLTYDEKQEQLIITRPAFDGKNMADFVIDPSLASVITIRTGVMGKAEYKEDKQGEMLYVYPECLKEERQDLIYHGVAGKSGKEVHLDTARIIVSGGRGMKGEEGFALLERLAEKIGGEVACTRPCVDAGWMLPTQQVGQSGISVKPKLYLAFGIAGAIQHMTGIDADCIISVNNNPRAAIFAYSDYGVVSDAKKLLESMLKQMEEGKEFL